jgi:hypothetical protein
MTGRDVINKIVQVEMPDRELVKKNSIRQGYNKNRVNRLRWSTMFIAVVVCLTLTTMAYAAARFIGERLDTGGSVEFVAVQGDYHEQAGTEFLTMLYNSDITLKNQPYFNAKTARLLNNMLIGKVFSEKGAPVELLAPVKGLFSSDYQADDKGDVLHDSDGAEIGIIYYASVINGEPYRISIWAKEEIEKQLGSNATYEEAVSFIGRDFKLPAEYTGGLESPGFNLTSYIADSETDESAQYEVKQVTVQYIGLTSPNMRFIIENIRQNKYAESPVSPRYIPGGIIEEFEIAGTTVHKIYSNEDSYNDFINYSWEHDGLSYILNTTTSKPSYTDEYYEKIIKSIIE